MSNLEDITFEGVEIKLNGKTMKLLYTAKGMKILAQKFGTVYKGLTCLKDLNYEMDESSIDKMCWLLYAGLIHSNKDLTIEEVEEFFSFDQMPYIASRVTMAMSGSLPKSKPGNA